MNLTFISFILGMQLVMFMAGHTGRTPKCCHDREIIYGLVCFNVSRTKEKHIEQYGDEDTYVAYEIILTVP